MAINPIQVIEIRTDNQATILESIRRTHEVKTGVVCSGPLDIVCIDDVCNIPSKSLYWTIEVNGDYESVNSVTLVKPQDKVILKYSRRNK